MLVVRRQSTEHVPSSPMAILIDPSALQATGRLP